MRNTSLALLVALGLASFSVMADPASAQKLADKYAVIAKNIDPESKGLSADAGKARPSSTVN